MPSRLMMHTVRRARFGLRAVANASGTIAVNQTIPSRRALAKAGDLSRGRDAPGVDPAGLSRRVQLRATSRPHSAFHGEAHGDGVAEAEQIHGPGIVRPHVSVHLISADHQVE